MSENIGMKYFVCLLLLSFFIAFYSCNDDKEMQLPNVDSKVLTGVWEYRNRVGGMVPYTTDEFKPGNGYLWTFGKSSYQSIVKDSVYRSGTYAISPGTGTDLNTGRTVDQFIFNGEPAESFELRDDTLRFYYGEIAYDGDILMYVKVSDDSTDVAH